MVLTPTSNLNPPQEELMEALTKPDVRTLTNDDFDKLLGVKPQARCIKGCVFCCSKLIPQQHRIYKKKQKKITRVILIFKIIFLF